MLKSISELAHVQQFLECAVKQVTPVEGSVWGYDGTYCDNAAQAPGNTFLF